MVPPWGLSFVHVFVADTTDVGKLQSARHTLVYNHHHQLFSAGDTIASLNLKTPQLISIVTQLQEKFSEMSQLTDTVSILDQQSGLSAAERQRAGMREAVSRGLERVRLMMLAEGELPKPGVS